MKLLKQLCMPICGAIILGSMFMPVDVMAQPTPAPTAPTPPAVGTTPPTGETPPAVPAIPPAVTTAAPGQPAPPVAATPPAVAPQAGPGTPVAPAATMALATPPVNSASWQAIEPVRQAIARRDYTAAQQALEQAKQSIPNDPAITVYENLIRTGMMQSATGRNDSVVRTPMPGVTPLPVVATPTVTPEPTPVPTPVPTFDESASSGGAAGGLVTQAQNLMKNDTIKYAVYGVGALIVLLILWLLFRKKKQPESDQSEAETPVPGTLSAVGGLDSMNTDFSSGFDPNAGSTDFGLGSAETDLSGGGAAGSDAAPDFTTFGLDDDEEEKPAKPTFTPRPAVEEDEGPLSLSDDDEPTAIISEPLAPTEPVEPQEPVAPAEPTGGVTFESLGLEPPSEPEPAPGPANIAPSSSAPVSSDGEVNLDDIFGSQGFPGSQGQQESPATPPPSDEDSNSQTMPTFVSKPDSENPEDSVEIPGKGQRQSSEESGDQTISFDELFGGNTPASTPAVNAESPAPEPTPESEAPGTTGEPSIEDALAATLGAMQAQDPDAAEAPPAAAAADVGTGETLDERTERMFSDQMKKAHQAMESKDWRQAVHVLSIASALQPDNEEAKQMLRDARAEKRKAEESV